MAHWVYFNQMETHKTIKNYVVMDWIKNNLRVKMSGLRPFNYY